MLFYSFFTSEIAVRVKLNIHLRGIEKKSEKVLLYWFPKWTYRDCFRSLRMSRWK